MKVRREVLAAGALVVGLGLVVGAAVMFGPDTPGSEPAPAGHELVLDSSTSPAGSSSSVPGQAAAEPTTTSGVAPVELPVAAVPGGQQPPQQQVQQVQPADEPVPTTITTAPPAATTEPEVPALPTSDTTSATKCTVNPGC